MKKNKIFVQIASYRDNQLLPTLRDCISNANNPENLVFCIAWQHSIEDAWDTLDEYKNDKRFKIIDIESKDSKGACWARNAIQQFYNDEEYTLQLDSHHRFITNWDIELITMFEQLKNKGIEKPLLTSYLPSFDPENDPAARKIHPVKLNLDRIIPEGPVFFAPSEISDFESLTEPIPSRFYSAHFCFGPGIFCREVQHDPEYYFHGEEITIGIRSYTWGYDLFSPVKVIAWHEYTRKYRTKHWDDHSTWSKHNLDTHSRVRKLLGIDGEINDIDFGKYGLGTIRSLDEYEKYAGIQFKTRGVQQYTLDNKLPPNPTYDNDDEYQKSFIKVFKHSFNIHKPRLQCTNYKFIGVFFEDEKGGLIHRHDLNADDVKKMRSDPTDIFYKFMRTFTYTGKKPYKCVIWPNSDEKKNENNGWCERIDEIIYKHEIKN